MTPYLFLHIPKTGGTSIAEALPKKCRSTEEIYRKEEERRNEDIQKYGFGAPRHHYTLEQYNKAGLSNFEGFDKLFKFAFVRNPWDRVVSIFHDWKKQNVFTTVRTDLNTGRRSLSPVQERTDEYFPRFVREVLGGVFFDPGSIARDTLLYPKPLQGCPYYYTISKLIHFLKLKPFPKKTL